MAQDIIIRGQTYLGAEKVDIPLANAPGTAEFYDTSDATMNSAAQSLNGVTSWANGVKYTGNIQTKTSSDLSVSGATVTAPAGYYASNATKSVASGTVTAPASISGSSATVSTGSNTLTLSKTVSVTPNVTTAGYVSSGSAGNSSVSLTASVTTKAAATYHPSTSDQSISASTYLTGAQTIKAVTYSGLSASNIIAGATVKIGDADDDDRIVSVSGSAQVPIVSYDTTTHTLSIS